MKKKPRRIPLLTGKLLLHALVHGKFQALDAKHFTALDVPFMDDSDCFRMLAFEHLAQDVAGCEAAAMRILQNRKLREDLPRMHFNGNKRFALTSAAQRLGMLLIWEADELVEIIEGGT